MKLKKCRCDDIKHIKRTRVKPYKTRSLASDQKEQEGDTADLKKHNLLWNTLYVSFLWLNRYFFIKRLSCKKIHSFNGNLTREKIAHTAQKHESRKTYFLDVNASGILVLPFLLTHLPLLPSPPDIPSTHYPSPFPLDLLI